MKASIAFACRRRTYWHRDAPFRASCCAFGACLLWAAVARAAEPGHEHVQMPRVTRQEPAEYPASELAARHEATVVLLVVVKADGSVGEITVDESGGPAFDEAAARAVRGWNFEPARSAGEPVASRIKIPFRFELPSARGTVPEQREEPPSLPSTRVRAPETSRARLAPKADPHVHAGPHPIEVSVVGERDLRTEARSAGDFRVLRAVLRAAPRKEGAEVLRTAPGLYIGRGEGPAVAHHYMLRGFDAEHGQDIEFRVGGLPVNQPSHLHGQGYADLGFLIGEVVRELRVSEGVYDPRQGDFAVAGSIDVELGVEPDERGLRLSSGYGSFDTFRELALWAPRESERETFGAVQYTKSDGFGENRAGQGASALLQHRFGEGDTRFRLIGIGYGARSELAGVVRADDVEAGRVCFDCVYPYATARAQNAAASRMMVGFFAEQRGPNGSNGELGVWLDQASFREQLNFTGFTQSSRTLARVAGRGDLIEQQNQSRSVGLMGRYRTAPFHPARWAHGTVEVGSEARFDLIDQSQNLIDASVNGQTWDERVDASIRAMDLGLWGDLDWHFAQALHVRFGLRADVLAYEIDDRLGNFAPQSRPQDAFIPGFRRSAFGVVWGPRTSAEVRPLDWVSVLAAYGEGYRSPQARTLDDGEATPFTKVRSADAGVRFDWGAPLRLSVGAFFTRLSDDVAFAAEEGRLERIGATERLGAVLSLLSRPAPWLLESLSITAVRATLLEPPPATSEEPQPPFGEGQRLPFVPPLVLRNDLGTEHQLTRRVGLGELHGRTGLGLSFLSPRPLPYGGFSDPVALLDASAGLDWGPLALSFELYNLLNREYAALEYSFPSHWDPNAPRPRTPARHLAAGAPFSWMLTLGVTL